MRKRIPEPPGRRKSGRTELQQGEAKGCSCFSGSQHDTVWARSYEGVVGKALFLAWRRRSNHSGRVRGLRQFFAEPAGESQSLCMARAEQYPGLFTADMHQKMLDKSGRDRWRRE